MKQIFLSGFMGAGKTTVGRVLSLVTEIPLIDLDVNVSKKAGLSIPQIFEQQGEKGFRQLECQCLLDVVEPAIISLGGGAITTEFVREHIRSAGYSIFLEWPIETLIQRVSGDSNRPLAKDPDAMTKLYESRLEWYRQASWVWSSKPPHEETPNMIAEAIISQLKKAGFFA